MSAEDERRRKLAQISTDAAAYRAPCAIVLIDGAESHVVVSDGAGDDPEALYLAGQQAIYALTLFLEQFRPAAEAAAYRKARSS